jgi:Family of unknown function (DUF5522)
VFVKQRLSYLYAAATLCSGGFFMSRFDKLEPDEYYMNEDGYIVFTEKYHLKRGYCCKNGCKHCPYGYNKKTGRFDKKKEE